MKETASFTNRRLTVPPLYAFAPVEQQKAAILNFFFAKICTYQKKAVPLRPVSKEITLNIPTPKTMRCNKFIGTFLIVSMTFVYGATHAEEVMDTPKGVHPFKVSENETDVATDFAYWSLIFDAGFNSFDGDFNSEMKHPVYAPSVGVGLEYTFNPFIGLGINYMFDMYRVSGNETAADVLLNGMVHRAGLYLPIDMVSCFVPHAKKRIFNLQLIVGGGVGWYKNSVYYTQSDRGKTLEVASRSMDVYKFCPYYNVGVDFEFNLGRSTALGIRGMYNYFTRDEMDGRYGGASTNNDGLIDVTVSFRYKIGAQKRSHTRNVASMDQSRAIAKGNRNVAKTPSPTAESVAQEIMDKGLIPTGKDTLLIVQKDTLIQTAVGKSDNSHFVYFSSGKAELEDHALIAIQQLAARMLRDTTLYALITGYCDNTGSESFNNALSQKRADIVVRELTEEHNIAANRVVGYGAGKIIGRRNKAAYTPNRRCEVQLLSKEAFDKKKQAWTVEQPVSEAVQAIPANNGVLDTVVVTKGMTLARLARKYYGYTDAWKYIYEANKDCIANPDKLTEGTQLVIPVIEK